MGKDKFTFAAHERTRRSVEEEGGSATRRGEQRHREGRGLDPLVDPKGFGVIRRSLNRFEQTPEGFVMTIGQAILKETRFDTTGSMGHNVQLAFKALPRSYHLLMETENAPLARYDLQIINSIFGDVRDQYVLCRSQAEMAEKIGEQLRLMVPEGAGADSDEDPQYGLFGAAYLTDASIVKTGLKSYDFTVTDACGRSRLDERTLIRVFGDEVFDKVAENGYQINRSKLPSTREVVQDLLKISHAFLIQVEKDTSVHRFWTEIYGEDRVIVIPTVEFLPEVEAAIVGLTEGVLSLQNVEEFLVKEAEMNKGDAARIVRAVAGIPVGAQAILPNFNRLPKAGDVFASKSNPWPIEADGTKEEPDGSEEPSEKVWI